MSFKLDGAKFPTKEELIDALFPIYQDKMSLDEFKEYVNKNVQSDDK